MGYNGTMNKELRASLNALYELLINFEFEGEGLGPEVDAAISTINKGAVELEQALDYIEGKEL
jgi:hypothetical protein